MTPSQREFLDGFLAIAQGQPGPDATAAQTFQRRIMARWPELVQQVHDGVAERFDALGPRARRALALLEQHPSLLRPLGQERRETSHAAMVAWTLQQPAPEIRQAFLRCTGADAPLDDWQVRTEQVIGPGCRVDIAIHVPGRWRCYIECKLDAEERPKQLRDYRALLDEAASAGQEAASLVFLTINGRDSDEADVPHVAVSFSDLLVAWLPLAAHPAPEALLFRMWLVTVADTLYRAWEEGPVSGWSLQTRLRLLPLLHAMEAPDA